MKMIPHLKSATCCLVLLALPFPVQRQETVAPGTVLPDNSVTLENHVRNSKFNTVLPRVMRDNEIDMWIHVMRPWTPDPLNFEFGSDMGIFIFTDRGQGRIERAVFARRWLGPDAGGRLAQFGIGAVFVVNGLRVLSGIEMAEVPAGEVLRWVYPIVLYMGYWLTRAEAGNVGLRMPLLYAGHLAAMIAVHSSVETSQVFTSVMTSVSWGVIAVAGLVVALQLRDRTLGQSSFLVFAISGMKVLLYDLAGAAPLVRIGSLVALGMSLFVGGWLYQMLSGSEARERVN